MLDALNSWTTKAMVGAKWKNVVKQDVQRGIDTAVADIEKELVKECGNEQGGALAADVVRDRVQLFAGLRTERQELSALRHRAPPFVVYQLPRPDGRIRFTASEMHKLALASPKESAPLQM
ncbi:hypothetical protein AB1Y20_016131 [Prymnesium parvum]|uniref:Uncharacterized protein n=1 Tax=Prymnesium parvum TaxID=97485 RepID=A0AB34JZR6_PRYPA